MRRFFAAVVGLIVVVVVAAFALWSFVLKTDPAPRAKVKQTATIAARRATVDGTYTVKPGNPNNFVGYRATEKLLGSIVENTATGRTDSVTGALTISDTTVSNVVVTADLQLLTSDQGGRDVAMRDQGLESNQFPQAEFVLTHPIMLAAAPVVGQTITAQATGDFTLHGVTRSVVITLEGRWDGTTVQVVGTLPIVFGDYNIEAPTAPVVLSVDDHAEMEPQLFFEKPIGQQSCAQLAMTGRDLRSRLALPKRSQAHQDATRDTATLERRVDQLGGCPDDPSLQRRTRG